MRLLAALLLLQPPAAPARPAQGWYLYASPPDAYAVDTVGRPTDRAGATVALRARAGSAPAAGAYAALSVPLAADTLRRRRVRVTAELRTREARGGAAVGLSIQGANRAPLLADAGMDDAVRGTADWTVREVTLPVPADAQQVIVGVIMRNGAEVEVRGLRVEVLPGAAAGAPLAPDARVELDSAIALARAHSLWRDTVTWSAVEPQARELAAGAGSAREVYPAIRYLLGRLGDHHSFLQPARVAADWEAGRTAPPDAEVRALADGIGYVAVPAYGNGDVGLARAYTQRLHAALAGVMPTARCGWVVDLRGNGGGNMFPMLAGLKPFLGGGVVGSFWRPGLRPGDSVETVVAGRWVELEPPPALAALEQAYVAVLTGPRTGSSGEVVTVAFRGRPRTRSFGAPTAGLTTGNERFVLPDGAAILLTRSVYVDRTGARYGGTIAPDSLVGPPGATVPAGVPPAGAPDAALDAATAWLRQASGCAAAR
jgi:hypothetical protein